MNIIIFKTTVQNDNDLNSIRTSLNNYLGLSNWTFALDDCDKILRVVSNHHCSEEIIDMLNCKGFYCEEMPYSLDEFKV